LVFIERPPKLHIGYFEMTLHVGIAFKVGFALKLPKSPMGYIETNLNMGIAFRVRYSYDFEIPTRIYFHQLKIWL